MKPLYIKLVLSFSLLLMIVVACKKEVSLNADDQITSKDFIYNLATKTISPDDSVNVQINSPTGVKLVYFYLSRENKNDSLIHVAYPKQQSPNDLKLVIPTQTFADSKISIKGIKVLIKHVDDSSDDGFIKVTYFDPAKPRFEAFPTTINANITGGITLIGGKVISEHGLKKVDVFDDFQIANTYVLSKSYPDLTVKQFDLNYQYAYRKASQHIKVVATDIYNQTSELILNMPVDVSLFKPKLLNFPGTVSNGVAFTGKVTSPSGLKTIEIFDDKTGPFEIVNTIGNLNTTLDYNFNYTYSLRKRAENIKIVATDIDDVKTELIIKVNTNYSSIVYRDVFMTAQTLGTNTVFFAGDGTTKGNCDLNASEATMSFLFYATSTGPTFYSPTNTASISANLRCNGTPWTISNPSVLAATRFRVLVNGSSTGQTDVYNLFAANEIDDLSDAFFTSRAIGTPGSSGPRFDAVAAASATIFNLTDAKLIYARIPLTGGATRNAIIHVKEATSSVGNSTIKFDLYIQK